MQKKKKQNHTKKRNENTFYHFVPFRGPRNCVTSATFLCCTPATNTDVAGPGAGCLHFVYLGCKALENLSLSCTNGHLTPYWELNSHCLLCIPITDFFYFPRLRSVSFRTRLGFFFISQKQDFISQMPFFFHTDNAKGNGIWVIVIVKWQSLMHTWGENAMPLTLFCYITTKIIPHLAYIMSLALKELDPEPMCGCSCVGWCSQSGLVKSTQVTLVPATQTLGNIGEVTYMQRHHLT